VAQYQTVLKILSKDEIKKIIKTENKKIKEEKERFNNLNIDTIFVDLQKRKINPSGEFDNAGRFYAENGNLINVRAPSRKWPYSQMVACRTRKYVLAVAKYFACQSEQDVRNYI
jgi:redox-regulated HSP33 family molecular chaperone